jgi:hypothetical protein
VLFGNSFSDSPKSIVVIVRPGVVLLLDFDTGQPLSSPGTAGGLALHHVDTRARPCHLDGKCAIERVLNSKERRFYLQDEAATPNSGHEIVIY